MTVCVPMKELKNTASFTRTVQTAGEPVIVTNNGKEAFVSMTPEYYDKLRFEAARLDLYQSLERAEEDRKAGRVVDAREFIDELRDRYGL